jgi:uncharacterized protein GlcG (DUF336 family)
MNCITLSQANTVITAAFAKGSELDLKPLNVAMLDAGGHLIAFQRQDGASALRPHGVSSCKVSEMAAERPRIYCLPRPHVTLRRHPGSRWRHCRWE